MVVLLLPVSWPVLGFTRIAKEPINDHSQVYNCDYVIVLDETLLDNIDVTQGIKTNGLLIINSLKSASEFNFQNNITVQTFDATGLALEILGIPLANTAMLGVIVAITDIVNLNSVYRAIDDFLPQELQKKNKKVVEVAHNSLKGVN